MRKPGRPVAFLLFVVALFALSTLPALAQEEEGEVAPEPISEEVEEGSSGLEPAVPIPDPANEEVVPDWTYRYLVPTGLALAVVVILITSVQYFTSVVRKRYRIVEE